MMMARHEICQQIYATNVNFVNNLSGIVLTSQANIVIWKGIQPC
jgi:hypothetical protein